MVRLTTSFLVVASIALTFLATSEAGNVIPPLFREYPPARVNELPRANEAVNYRLPNNTEPVHYDVELTTEVHSGKRDFTGKVSIQINIVADTRTIVIHARQLSGFVAYIKKLNEATEHALDYTFEEALEFLTLTPREAAVNFQAGEKYVLTIEYKGSLRLDNGGFYLSTYSDENGNTRYLATTQFESTDARHGFPCYDEPAKRATFTITINHDPSYVAISNMPVDDSKTSTGKTVFQETKSMPTYLIAFIISDFKSTQGALNSLPQRVFSRAGTEGDQEWALVSGMLLIESLGAYYGIKFAFPKLDQVAVPDFAAGAMENWGLATYREEYLLYNKHKSTVNTQTNVANIIAHEYTHQWFGNLVAIKWWSYLWLKEGFATLFSYHATEDTYPEWGVQQMFHTDEYQTALNADAGTSPRPMTYYVQQPNEISRLYDSISYSKAGAVLAMFQHALTDKVFRQGLHNYLEENQFQAAVEEDLFEAIQRAAKEEDTAIRAGRISDMMSSWTRQGGYPVLHVERNYNDGSFKVTQEAFFNDDKHKSENLWYVPLNWATQSQPDFRDTSATRYLEKVKEVTVTNTGLKKEDWLILNKQSTGYYRINYDKENWALITRGLVEKPYRVHPRNRAQLMHDAYRFSVSNRLEHATLMELLAYLHQEDQYAPWSTANGILTTFNRYLSGDAHYNDYKAYVAELVGNIYEKLGVNDIPGEQHFQKYTRSVAINLACMAGIESCLQETNNKLKGLIERNIEIEPNLQSQTFCNGLKQASDADFDFVYNLLMNSEDQAQRRILISSLGCAQKDSQITKFIESSIDTNNKLRTQERTTLLSPAYSRGEVGLYACINFLKQHWEEYAALTVGTFGGGNPLNDAIVGMSGYVVNDDQQKALLELVDTVKDSGKVSETLERNVNNNIKANFDWLAQNRGPVMGWLSNYYRAPQDDGSASLHVSFLTLLIVFVATMSRLF